MKHFGSLGRFGLAATLALGLVAAAEAAPTDAVSQADIAAILERLAKLEAQNQAQAKRIAELESMARGQAPAATVVAAAPAQGAESGAAAVTGGVQVAAIKCDATTQVDETGTVYTTRTGKKYYLADATAGIFEPLSESGLKVTPYGYLVLEGIYADHGLDADYVTDFVHPKSSSQYGEHNSTLSMQDSILGLMFETPNGVNGWKFSGKAEFDLCGSNADDYALHWRHLYVDAAHEDSGWSLLFGQTWHLWKMVTPSEIDGAWMENTGHPYRRSPQVRVTKRWQWEQSSLEARVGFVKNGPNASSDRDGNGQLDSSASAWGWLEAALVYDRQADWEKAKRNWRVGLGGMFGRDASHRLSPDGNWGGSEDNYNSQMVMLAAAVPFLDKFTLTGQVYGGENLGRIQAGCGQGVSFNPDHYYEKGREVPAIGGFVDLKYELNEKWDFAVGYGFDDPNVKDGMGVACNDGSGINMNYYEFNDRMYIDAFYHITPNFRIGLEYARLHTKYAEDGSSYANRFQFSVFYDF